MIFKKLTNINIVLVLLCIGIIFIMSLQIRERLNQFINKYWNSTENIPNTTFGNDGMATIFSSINIFNRTVMQDIQYQKHYAYQGT